MRIVPHVLALCGAAVLSCCTQTTGSWDALNEQAIAAFRAGNDDACIDAERKAIALAETETDPKSDHLVNSLNYVGACALNKGDPATAREAFERARAVAEKAGDNLTPNFLTTINGNLAALAWAQGRKSDAEALAKENLERVEKVFSPDSENVSMSKAQLASLYIDLGRYDEAEPLVEDALAICGRIEHGCQHQLPMQDIAARVYTKQHKFDKAEAMFARTLEYEERDRRADVSRAQTLQAVGDLAVEKGDDARALATYQRAIKLATKAYPEPGLMARMEGDLAAVYTRQGRDAEAEPLFRKAIAVQEKAIGMDAAPLVKNLEGLAGVCERTGKGDEASSLRNRATAMGTSIH